MGKDEVAEQLATAIRRFLRDDVAAILDDGQLRTVQVLDEFHSCFARRHPVLAGEDDLARAVDGRRRCFAVLVSVAGLEVRGELARHVAAVAKLNGQFRLRSGQVTDTYFDKYQFESDPVLLSALAAPVPTAGEVWLKKPLWTVDPQRTACVKIEPAVRQVADAGLTCALETGAFA